MGIQGSPATAVEECTWESPAPRKTRTSLTPNGYERCPREPLCFVSALVVSSLAACQISGPLFLTPFQVAQTRVTNSAAQTRVPLFGHPKIDLNPGALPRRPADPQILLQPGEPRHKGSGDCHQLLRGRGCFNMSCGAPRFWHMPRAPAKSQTKPLTGGGKGELLL